jgi:hypothetical protein
MSLLFCLFWRKCGAKNNLKYIFLIIFCPSALIRDCHRNGFTFYTDLETSVAIFKILIIFFLVEEPG